MKFRLHNLEGSTLKFRLHSKGGGQYGFSVAESFKGSVGDHVTGVLTREGLEEFAERIIKFFYDIDRPGRKGPLNVDWRVTVHEKDTSAAEIGPEQE